MGVNASSDKGRATIVPRRKETVFLNGHVAAYKERESRLLRVLIGRRL